MNNTIKMRRTKAYKVIMSSGPPIPIDEEEVAKVLQGRQEGVDVVLKRGAFNPSHYVSIVEDGDRISEWKSDCRYTGEVGELSLIHISEPTRPY